MKALLIKYHGPTNTLGSRYSVRSEGYRNSYVPYYCELDCNTQVENLAKRYFLERFRIKPEQLNFRIGVLPNGDYVAVLI
jgi:hypothetical protein